MPTSNPRSVPQLFRNPAYRTWSLASILFRLPGFMAPLGFVLIGVTVASRSVGGLMVTAEVGGIAVGAPLLSRWVDRVGARRGVLAFSLALTAMFIALALMAALRAPGWSLISGAGLAGFLSSPRSPGLRALLDDVVPKPALQDALTLNATVSEFAVLCAPLIVAVMALSSAIAVALAMAATTAAGAAVLLTLPISAGDPHSPTTTRTTPQAPSRIPLLRIRELWFWIALYAGFGQLFGTVETGALPWARALHLGTWGASTALAILSASGIVVNLFYARRPHSPTPSGPLRLLATMTIGCLGLAFSPNWWLGAASLGVMGAAAVPLLARASFGVGHAVPAGQQAEGFGVTSAVQTAAYGLGGALLAVLPIHWMILAGTSAALVTLALAPVWTAHQTARVG
ncbi:MFS transporter [Sulfobacillus harzensis]|uniref:MFS transporter n=1 Tax=Sulfobacillus harzensis TaxID=2729629 RepID=A0A7Y0L0Y7_9FIRM|nr:MFS transporter [Sulfobacillus harzensis]NMP21267.1 MFS transporter [Sulfobacillus harzensis]